MCRVVWLDSCYPYICKRICGVNEKSAGQALFRDKRGGNPQSWCSVATHGAADFGHHTVVTTRYFPKPRLIAGLAAQVAPVRQ